MDRHRFVLGLLDISDEVADRSVADKYRDLTVSWSRYDYRGEIIEADGVNEILDRATVAGYQWCLILPYGHVIAEKWRLSHLERPSFFSALSELMDRDDFLIAGSIVGDHQQGFGLADRCLLVNLQRYQQLEAPRFELDCRQPISIPDATMRVKQGRIAELLPSSHSEVRMPSGRGWHFVATSLRHGIPVVGFEDELLDGLLDLSATCASRTRTFANYLCSGIANHDADKPDALLGRDQVDLLDLVQPQTSGARNGVFLWNIEAYSDIETPPEGFAAPISSLYSVAAGFKPNRILHTHGCDPSSKVVFFDYSKMALEIRRYMVDHWDGLDFPDFVEHLFEAFPHPQTFYQLWSGATPDNVSRSEIEQMWQNELAQWGSASAFHDHWRLYRELEHHFLLCDLMTDPSPLLGQIEREPDAVIWWSNAFFTVYGNWHYSLDERKRSYDAWIEKLADRNSELFIYGSDCNNVNVNSIRAGEYWEAYQSSHSDCLVPCRLFETEMRM